MSNQYAIADGNRVPGLLGHSSTDNSAETIRIVVTSEGAVTTTSTDAITGIAATVKANSNTSNNELLVNLEGHQCSENSTTDQLEADEVFTGSGWQDTIDYGVVSVNVNSDVDSATDGLDLQWSNNGTDVIDHDYFTIFADTPKTFTFGPAERYYRIIYTNGSGGTTTTFHLSSLLRRVYVKPSTHRINDSIVGQDDAELVKAVSTGLAPDGTFKNVLVTNGGNQKISIEEFESDVSTNSNTQLKVTNYSSDGSEGVKLQDTDGSPQGLLIHDNVLGIVSAGHLMAAGLVSGHQTLFKIGYNPAITTTEETVWSAGGTYVFPTAEQQMEVVSTDNTDDIGVVIKGDATGNTVQSDADGTTTTLEDDDVDFTSATVVAAGDCVILDPHGSNPEFGTVTTVATHTLTVAGGFNKGGSGASRYYAVVDMSAHTGATVVQFGYLDGDYVRHREIVVLNGTTPVNTVNTDIYRINGVNVVHAGSNGVPSGSLSVRNTAGTVTYGYITAGYNISRQAVFTIPAGITGYLTSANISASSPNDVKVQSCRIIVRSNTTPDEDFKSSLLYPKAEFDITNSAEEIPFEIPLKLVEKSDFIVSAQGFSGFSGPVVGVFRGYLVQND